MSETTDKFRLLAPTEVDLREPPEPPAPHIRALAAPPPLDECPDISPRSGFKNPIRAFIVSSGVLVGHTETLQGAGRQLEFFATLRIHAPAIATMTPEGILTAPLALVESHIDVNTAMLLGESPVGAALREAYSAYAARFALDGFRTHPLTTPAFVRATPECPSPALTRSVVLSTAVAVADLSGLTSIARALSAGHGKSLSAEDQGVELHGSWLLVYWPAFVERPTFRFLLEAMRILPVDRVDYALTAAGVHHNAARQEGLLPPDVRASLQESAVYGQLVRCSLFSVQDILPSAPP